MLKQRCAWASENDLLKKYHDEEWGISIQDDRKHFEMLLLEGAQAGLNWLTILSKRENYRRLFKEFDPTKIAKMRDEELNECLKNPGIIRNHLKIYSARKNAIAFLKIQKEFGSFYEYIRLFFDQEKIIHNYETTNDLTAQTEKSKIISNDLKKRGMSFVGPTIIYAYLQAVGLVNAHTANCWLFRKFDRR